MDKVLCKRCNGKGYYKIGSDEIACPECHPWNPQRIHHFNGTIKEEDIDFFVNSRLTDSVPLGRGEMKRMVFVNQNRYLLQRGRSNVYVLWTSCEYCNTNEAPDWNDKDHLFTCSMCNAPV